jgi:hypothetical protein
VLDPTRSADYTIWVVAAVLYASDATRFLSAREFLLVEAGRGHLVATFSANPYTLAGRVVAFAPLFLPYRGVFVAPWGRAWTDDTNLKAALESIERLRSSLIEIRVVATWAFFSLFALGPLLTLLLGTAPAILYTAGVLYPTAITAIMFLWWRRRQLRLSTGRCVGISIEILVCPAFLPNLVRKITALESVKVDGAQILATTGASDVKQAFLSLLESRTEELIEATDADDPAHAQLREYLATIRPPQ